MSQFEPKDPFHDALLRLADALVDVGCCLDRFEVDSIQCLSWKSHIYLAKKSHILPVRLLHRAEIGGCGSSVSAQDGTRGSVSLNGTPQQKFRLALAATKHSDLKYISFYDPVGDPITDEELAQIASVAPTVKVTDLRLYGRLTHLLPAALHLLIFDFSSIQELTFNGFNGNQLTDQHLRDCGRRHTWRLHVITEVADAGALAFSDEALLDYLFTPKYEMPTRAVILTAFNVSPQFVQKLVSRAHLATNVGRIDLQVNNLPLGSQQIENGSRLRLQFRGMIRRVPREPMPPPCRMQDVKEESNDKFFFTLSK
ncbi:hypothetical protein AAVH_12450 [Aphelenchoides avenae]|nr:hypothetical protein AAVH_12450 [Aphelenchus avenae]